MQSAQETWEDQLMTLSLAFEKRGSLHLPPPSHDHSPQGTPSEIWKLKTTSRPLRFPSSTLTWLARSVSHPPHPHPHLLLLILRKKKSMNCALHSLSSNDSMSDPFPITFPFPIPLPHICSTISRNQLTRVNPRVLSSLSSVLAYLTATASPKP